MRGRAHIIRTLLPLLAVIVFTCSGCDTSVTPNSDSTPVVDMNGPQVSVTASYPGASPETVERDVARPIETALKNAHGASHISTFVRQDKVTLTISFRSEIEETDAVMTVKNHVETVKMKLPPGVAGDISVIADSRKGKEAGK